MKSHVTVKSFRSATETFASRLSGIKVGATSGAGDSAMPRKEELLEMARLLRSQADAMNSRDAKQAFRKMADYYEQEAKKLQNTPNIFARSKKARSPKSAA
jgi:hypothetical protein